MLKSLLLGAILGGLTAFLWNFVSYSVLPWHLKQYHVFQSEDEVSALISSHAPESGIYLLPLGPSQQGMDSEQKKAAMEIRTEKMKRGPLVFASVQRGGFDSFPKVLLTQLLCQMFAALLLTWMLLHTAGLSYVGRVAFLAIAGLAASVIADLPYWNWYGFPAVYTAMLLVGVWLYISVTRAADPIGRYAFAAYVGLLLMLYFGDRFSPPPANVSEIVWSGIIAGAIAVPWAWWFDAHRVLRPFVQ